MNLEKNFKKSGQSILLTTKWKLIKTVSVLQQYDLLWLQFQEQTWMMMFGPRRERRKTAGFIEELEEEEHLYKNDSSEHSHTLLRFFPYRWSLHLPKHHQNARRSCCPFFSLFFLSGWQWYLGLFLCNFVTLHCLQWSTLLNCMLVS